MVYVPTLAEIEAKAEAEDAARRAKVDEAKAQMIRAAMARRVQGLSDPLPERRALAKHVREMEEEIIAKEYARRARLKDGW